MQHASLQAGPALAGGLAVAPALPKGAVPSPEEALALLSGDPVHGADAGSLDLHGAAALWFKKEAFTAPEFDADAYVRDLRRYVRAQQADATRSRAAMHDRFALSFSGLTRPTRDTGAS